MNYNILWPMSKLDIFGYNMNGAIWWGGVELFQSFVVIQTADLKLAFPVICIRLVFTSRESHCNPLSVEAWTAAADILWLLSPPANKSSLKSLKIDCA